MIVAMVAQLCEYTKNHLIVHFKSVNCMACQLCPNKTIIFFKKATEGESYSQTILNIYTRSLCKWCTWTKPWPMSGLSKFNSVLAKILIATNANPTLAGLTKYMGSFYNSIGTSHITQGHLEISYRSDSSQKSYSQFFLWVFSKRLLLLFFFIFWVYIWPLGMTKSPQCPVWGKMDN